MLAARAWHALAPPLGLRAQFCEAERCRRFTVAHRQLRRDGIFLAGVTAGADHWLCGPQCFETALLAEIHALGLRDRGRRSAAPSLPRMPYHLALLQKGVLRQADLQRSQQHAERFGMRLNEALLCLSLVSEEQLAEAYARESGCAFYRPAPAPVAPAAVLPAALSCHFGAATVHANAERMVIGFTSRVHRDLAAMSAQMCGCTVETCFITKRHFREQLSLDCKSAEGEPTPVKPEGVAQAIVRHAEQLGAERVRLAGSGKMLWVRYCNEDGVICAQLHDAVFLVGEKG